MSREFRSFEDLGRFLKSGRRERELGDALEAARSGQAQRAIEIAERHGIESLSDEDKGLIGWCYAEAAKAALARKQWRVARDGLRTAFNLNHRPWHVQRRLQLVNRVLKGRLNPQPGEDWLQRYTFACRTCPYASPTPLVCAKCSELVESPLLPVFQDDIAGHYAPGVYRWQGDPDASNPLSRMIRWLKSNRGKEVCRYLAYLLVEALAADTDFLLRADLIVPVPADPQRLRRRGFDNIAELVQDMESLCLVPVARDVLVKPVATRDFRQLSWGERRYELEGSLDLDERKRHMIDGCTVLLIDDVVTSGTTLNVCARLLRAGGAKEVLAATLARSESTQMSRRLRDT